MVHPVRSIRLRIQLSQENLAKATGVSRQTINMIENGHTVPTLELALKLGRVLGVRVDRLFKLDRSKRLKRGTRAPKRAPASAKKRKGSPARRG
ncbi:MAG: helix-turn-helix transcriptional regulator [Planctomycetes bacterium]|nr:helix-turn-helix transcriptional regulator [Planctomycetota bacterium]